MRNLKMHAAQNYDTLPVILERGSNSWLQDDRGNRYLDLFSSYAVTNFGHKHPRLYKALANQMELLPVSSRVFPNQQFAQFCHDVAEFCNMDRVLPVVDGAGAVERAIKIARKWARTRKKKANRIICFGGNFHGRSYGALSMSDNQNYKNGFEPFLDGFTIASFGDVRELERVLRVSQPSNLSDGYDITAIFIEPIQGEAGVVIPPDGYLKNVRDFCTRNNILMVADEIQTGFGRTGYDLACQYENVQPDIYLLGKALGGGIVPISAIVAKSEVMDVIGLGDDGSTFGGYPLGCAVAIEAIKVLKEEELSENAKKVGSYFIRELKSLKNRSIVEVRGRGLMVGLELNSISQAKSAQLELLKQEVVCGCSHNVLRLSPPLNITQEEIDWALARIEIALLQRSVICG
ncbi:MAG: ornithine--oxo-acid transaminase [Candidatus Yanofskybacteria bacterium]|nr:ornithine--oxo-acid transaminase [Candidatus Yanofskybacteria bacterium]